VVHRSTGEQSTEVDGDTESMRLIDADELKERVEKNWGVLNLSWFITCINNSPTVHTDEAEDFDKVYENLKREWDKE